jgi:hypothetical protein
MWHKQTPDQPLFPDLLWSRPENRQQAGKLLIVGGNLYGFAAPASAYQRVVKTGVGTARVLLPSALQKTVGKLLENCDFAPSTPSGSFNQQALADWLENAAWADAVLLAGDLGRNSETAITIEKFVSKLPTPIIITKDAVDYFYSQPKTILERPDTCLVLSIAQLQKLTRGVTTTAVQFGFGLAQLVEWLSDFSQHHAAHIVVYHQESILVAVNGQVSTTKVGDQTSWRVETASNVAVWWLQNPSKPFEALTTGVLEAYKEE